MHVLFVSNVQEFLLMFREIKFSFFSINRQLLSLFINRDFEQNLFLEIFSIRSRASVILFSFLLPQSFSVIFKSILAYFELLFRLKYFHLTTYVDKECPYYINHTIIIVRLFQAQRNELNLKVRMLREELQLLVKKSTFLILMLILYIVLIR